VLAASFPSLGIGFLGVALAFGLTVLTMAYAVGHISGGHFNCAVTIGIWAGGRFKATQVLPYVVAQVARAILAAAVPGGSRACRTLRDAMGWSHDEDGGLGRSEPRDRAREEIPPETGTFPNRNVYKPESDRERDLILHDPISGIAASSRR